MLRRRLLNILEGSVVLSLAAILLTPGAALAVDLLDPSQLGYSVKSENHRGEVWVTYTDTTTGVRVRAKFGESARPRLVEEFSATGVLKQREIRGHDFWSKEIFRPTHVLVTQTATKDGLAREERVEWLKGRKRVSTSLVPVDWAAELNPSQGCFSAVGEGLGATIPDDITSIISNAGTDAPCESNRIGANTVLDQSCEKAGIATDEFKALFTEGVNRAVQCMKDPARANMSSTAAKMLLFFTGRPRGKDLRFYCTRMPTPEENTAVDLLGKQIEAAKAANDTFLKTALELSLKGTKRVWQYIPFHREGERPSCTMSGFYTAPAPRFWRTEPPSPPPQSHTPVPPTPQDVWDMTDTYGRATGPCKDPQFPSIGVNTENFKIIPREQRMAIIVHEMLHVMGFAHGQNPDVNNTLPLCCFNFYKSESDKNYQKEQCRIMRDANVVMH